MSQTWAAVHVFGESSHSKIKYVTLNKIIDFEKRLRLGKKNFWTLIDDPTINTEKKVVTELLHLGNTLQEEMNPKSRPHLTKKRYCDALYEMQCEKEDSKFDEESDDYSSDDEDEHDIETKNKLQKFEVNNVQIETKNKLQKFEVKNVQIPLRFSDSDTNADINMELNIESDTSCNNNYAGACDNTVVVAGSGAEAVTTNTIVNVSDRYDKRICISNENRASQINNNYNKHDSTQVLVMEQDAQIPVFESI
ncbi:hypothetical protein TKK_0012944 [Trichogramma kaykai]|uniref:MADF domain-containing protein n=1 Tax=Trichogramma kaykai TaxID=54128 RepID=A0ABD2WL14_9HYME